jgi:hypothetical protein
MRTQLVCLSLLLAGLMMSSSGCVVLAVGAGAAGAVAYAKGDLETEVHYGIDHVYAATKKAADDLKLHVITSEGGKDALSAALTARDAADKRVSIKLKTVTQDVTKMSIRIGTFGDQTKQRLICDKIRDNLKAMCPQPAQTPPATPSEQPAQTPPNAPGVQPAQASPNAPAAQPTQNPPEPPGPPEPAQPTPVAAAAVQQTAQTPPAPPTAQ